jgi:hypothetical protein
MGRRSDVQSRQRPDAAEIAAAFDAVKDEALLASAPKEALFPKVEVVQAEFRPETAACALVDAIYNGMQAACQQWNVPMDVLMEWRRRLKTGKTPEDAALRRLFAEKRAEMRDSWAEDAADTLIAANAFIRRAAQSNLLIPDMVSAVASAAAHLKGALTRDRMIDANYPIARPVAGILQDPEGTGEMGDSSEDD